MPATARAAIPLARILSSAPARRRGARSRTPIVIDRRPRATLPAGDRATRLQSALILAEFSSMVTADELEWDTRVFGTIEAARRWLEGAES